MSLWSRASQKAEDNYEEAVKRARTEYGVRGSSNAQQAKQPNPLNPLDIYSNKTMADMYVAEAAAKAKAQRTHDVRTLAIEIAKAMIMSPGMMVISAEDRAARAVKEAEALIDALPR